MKTLPLLACALAFGSCAAKAQPSVQAILPRLEAAMKQVLAEAGLPQ